MDWDISLFYITSSRLILQILRKREIQNAIFRNQANIRCLEDIIDNEKLISEERKLLQEKRRCCFYSLARIFPRDLQRLKHQLSNFVAKLSFFMFTIWFSQQEKFQLHVSIHLFIIHKEIFEIEKVLFFSLTMRKSKYQFRFSHSKKTYVCTAYEVQQGKCDASSRDGEVEKGERREEEEL